MPLSKIPNSAISGLITNTQLSTSHLDGSTAAKAPNYGTDVIAALGGSFSPGLYYLAPASAPAQKVYVDADGFMLFYRHAGTSGSQNLTYEIQGDTLGEGAVGTLTSPTMGLTTAGVSTTAGSRGMARLSTDFVRALGGNTDQNIIKMDVGGVIGYITDTQWYASSVVTPGSDNFGHDTTISYGSSAANPRSQRTNYDTGQTTRPLGTYPGGNPNLIPYYDGSGYSGGYNGTWHQSTTIWIRQPT